MADTSPVLVLLFARYAELLGRGQLHLPLPVPATVAAVVSAVRAMPGGSGLPLHPLVAVNARQAMESDPVRGGDEVALLPPMAGG